VLAVLLARQLAVSVLCELRRIKLQIDMENALSRDDYEHDYCDLFKLATEAYNIQSLLSVNMLMLLATMFKFFHLSPKLGVLTSTVSRASIELLWFMLLFFNVFIAYTVAFYMAFGSTVNEFATVEKTVYTLITVLLGTVDFDNLFEENAFLGPLLFWSFVVLVFMVLMSCFVAIIMEAYGEAKDHASKQHDPLADLVHAIVMDNWNAFVKTTNFVLGIVWNGLTGTRNVQLSSVSRLNVRVVKTQTVLDMMHETAHDTGLEFIGKTAQNIAHEAAGRGAHSAYLRRAAWRELRDREVASNQLMNRIKAARERQVALLREVEGKQAQQLRQLDEISTELWNAWQMAVLEPAGGGAS